MVWYGMVWYGMVWYGMVWYGMVWYGMVWYGMVWYGLIEWYGMDSLNEPCTFEPFFTQFFCITGPAITWRPRVASVHVSLDEGWRGPRHAPLRPATPAGLRARRTFRPRRPCCQPVRVAHRIDMRTNLDDSQGDSNYESSQQSETQDHAR